MELVDRKAAFSQTRNGMQSIEHTSMACVLHTVQKECAKENNATEVRNRNTSAWIALKKAKKMRKISIATYMDLVLDFKRKVEKESDKVLSQTSLIAS